MTSNVIVIGGGLAGIIAAKTVSKEGSSVTLIDRSIIGLGSNSAMSNAAFCLPSATYSQEHYVADTIEIGCELNKRSYVGRIAERIPEAFNLLFSLGIQLEHHKIHHQVPPTRHDVIPGSDMMRRLAASLHRSQKMQVISNFQIREIVRNKGRACGVMGINARGQTQFISADAVILAGGGAGAVYQINDNVKSALGQSYALASDAGLELLDMEFVQFYPLVLCEPRLPAIMIYPPYPVEARLLDHQGRDVMAKNGLGDLNGGIMKMRDQLSALLFEEMIEGPVRLDYTQVPSDKWERQPLAMLDKLKFDFRRNPFAVSPGAHFCMGGSGYLKC